TRYVHFASRLTGWNAIKSRVEQLDLDMTDAQVKECTAKIKQLADIRPLNVDDVDSIIRQYHADVRSQHKNIRPAEIAGLDEAAAAGKKIRMDTGEDMAVDSTAL